MKEIIIFLLVAIPVAVVLSAAIGLVWLFKDPKP